MRIVVHHEIPEDDNLRQQWNSLVQQMEQPEIFYTYDWALAVYRAYRGSLTPLLFLVYQDEVLVGVATLARTSNRKQLSFLAGFTADYCDFICLPRRRAEVLSALSRHLRNLNVSNLVLNNLPLDSRTIEALRADFSGYRIFCRPAYECSQVSIRTPEEREAVRRDTGTKRSLRYLKKGRIEVCHHKGYDAIAALLPNFIEWHVARFGRQSNVALSDRQTFLFQLARQLSSSGWMTLSEMLINGQMAGLLIGFTYARHWLLYQTAFDSNFQRYSPGFCLVLKLIQEACQSLEFDYLDLGLGDEVYKTRLTNTSRHTFQVTLAASTFTMLRTAARYHTATTIKRSPRVEHTVRLLLGRLSSGG